MSDFFGGGGSWKNSVDNYYTYTQTSGGGSFGGPKGCGSSATVILIILIVLFVIENFVAAIAAFVGISLLILFIYLIVKRCWKKRV